MGKLEGKIALIPGGNSGTGLASAKQFVTGSTPAPRTQRLSDQQKKTVRCSPRKEMKHDR